MPRFPSPSPLLALPLLLAIALAGCAPIAPATGPAEAPTAEARAADAHATIRDWPEKSREVAREAIEMYGTPHEVASGRLVWHEVGPWKRVIAYRAVVDHHFPAPHPDVLEGVIDYPIDPDRVSELTRFTGSLYVDRTRGEMSAKCDVEGANFLSINLGHDIMTGRRTAEEARAFYTQAMKQMKEGNPPPYTQGFQFELPRRGTADPGESTMEM
jgi:hypothetical protein